MLSSYNTLFVGKVCHSLKKLGSTNDFAMNLTKTTSVLDGTVVRTSYQFQGKGQMGNTWFSEPNKNLAVSVVLKPSGLNGANIYLLNMAVALALRDFAATYCDHVKVKWPNDIYVGERKVAGILVENLWKGSQVQFSVAGLGVNINQEVFPPDIPNPTSLFLETQKRFDLEEVYQQLLWHIEKWYLKFKQDPQAIKEQYLSQLLYFETPRVYKTKNNEELHGRIVDVSEAGKLMLMTESGLQAFGVKEISF